MKCDKRAMLLYAVTDRAWLCHKTLKMQVKEALEGGVTCIQLREKELDEESFLQEAIEISGLCKEYKVPFIVNDNIDIAIKSKATGVHVGQSDTDVKTVRKIVGESMIVGVSAQTVADAVYAEKNGADYLGVGAVFSTSTKKDADDVSYETLKAICDAVSVPVVAIGGIDETNMDKLKGSGIDGIAVVSALFSHKDVRERARLLRKNAIKLTNDINRLS